MSGSRLARWSPASGVLFVAIFVVSATLMGDVPGVDATDSKILSYYADHGNQLKLEIAFFVATLGAVFFLWFVGTLSGRLREVENEPRWLSGIVLVSGGAFTVVMLAGFGLGSMVAGSADHGGRFQVAPDTARLLSDFTYPLTFETALPLVAPLVLATSLITLRSGLMPRWLGWAGMVVALGCIAGVLGVTMGLFLIWVLVVAYYLIRREPRGPVPAMS